jgi:hypothetical protein
MTDQRTQQIRASDVTDAIHNVKLGEPPPHRKRAWIVQLSNDDLASPLAQYLTGQLTLGRVYLPRSRGCRGHGRGSTRPRDQTHCERRQTGDEGANLDRRFQALGRAKGKNDHGRSRRQRHQRDRPPLPTRHALILTDHDKRCKTTTVSGYRSGTARGSAAERQRPHQTRGPPLDAATNRTGTQ